ncbi:MAG: cob(I)yrinic acid a,c-diamide adenosyltransferase [Gaiellales bacterium]|nr:cob(I)yrinic acid a,c-diamide adenosyltransferase [Gaiellales bacterium]
MTGYVQVYTGNGKGKTTAALGLAMRAAGAGLRVLFAQFIKGMDYSELAALARFSDLIEVRRYGRGCFIVGEPEEEDCRLAAAGLSDAAEALASGVYDLVVLDEANVAVFFGLFSAQDLLRVVEMRPPRVELVITGRYAPVELIDRADLVTEMVEVKHYYSKGVEARRGIES